MAIHSTRKKFIGVALAATFLATSMPTPAQASLRLPSTRTALFILGTISWTILYSRKPVPKFKKNYDLHKLGDLRKIGTKQYWDNIHNLFYNGLIGQCAKGKHVKVDDEGSIKPGGKNCEAYGVLGTIDFYLKPYQKASKTMIYLYILYQLLDKDSATSFEFIKASKG